MNFETKIILQKKQGVVGVITSKDEQITLFGLRERARTCFSTLNIAFWLRNEGVFLKNHYFALTFKLKILIESVLEHFSAKNAIWLIVLEWFSFEAEMSDYIMVKSSDKLKTSSVGFYWKLSYPTWPYPPPTPRCRVLFKIKKITGAT